MLAKGRYRARPTAWTLGYTGSGKEQAAVELTFSDPNLEVPSMTWYGYFGENSLDITMRALRTMGFQGSDLSALLEAHGLNPDAEIEAVVDHDDYPKGSGQWHAKVKFVNAVGGLAIKEQMTADAARAFAARMKGELVANEQKTGGKKTPRPAAVAPPAKTAAPAGTPATTDDIPF